MAVATIGVRLDELTRERLKKLGETKQRSTHWLMKNAITRYLATEERYELEKAEDWARWQRYIDTGNALSHEDVKARLEVLAKDAAQKAEGL